MLRNLGSGQCYRNPKLQRKSLFHRIVDHCSGQVQPTGGFDGLNGEGGQYSFERSNGCRIGGGDPFDQSHIGQGGSVATSGNGTSLLVVDCCVACGVSNGVDSRSTEPGTNNSLGLAT